jgi:hypothetical protein
MTNLLPDKNLLIGAAAGILSKAAMSVASHYGITIDAETQGYILVVNTWLAAHITDLVSPDKKETK